MRFTVPYFPPTPQNPFLVTDKTKLLQNQSYSSLKFQRKPKIRMVYGGGMTCIKYLLFLFNFIFWLSGIGIIVAGAVIQIRYSTYMNILGDSFFSAPILLILAGCLIAILGFFGCCGAIRENYCMAMTFAVMLGLIFMLELAAGVAGYILRNELEQVIKTHALEGLSHYNMTSSIGVTDAWDRMQQNFHCCGITNYTDWQNNTWFEHNNDVPDSCCNFEENEKCDINVRNLPVEIAAEHIYTEPCAEKLRDWASAKMGALIGIVCVVAIIQVIGIVLSCKFGSHIHDAYDHAI